MTDPPKAGNSPTRGPGALPSDDPVGQVRRPHVPKDRPRRSAPVANTDRDHYWPRDAPIRWRSLFGGALKQATLIVAVVVHLVLGVLLVADLGFGLGPAGRGAAADWLLALTFAVLTVVVVRGWLFFSWWVVAGPVVVLAMLAWAPDGRHHPGTGEIPGRGSGLEQAFGTRIGSASETVGWSRVVPETGRHEESPSSAAQGSG